MNKQSEALIDLVAIHESGGSYSAWIDNDRDSGVSFGLLQFNQKGGLHDLCVMMEKVDAALFWAIFDDFSAVLLDRDKIRLADLSPAKQRFQDAADYKMFRECQRQTAYEKYLIPAVQAGRAHQLFSARAAAMCFDVAIQYGVQGLKNKLRAAEERLTELPLDASMSRDLRLLTALADVSDRHPYDKNRRHRLLKNKLEITDEAFYFE